MSAIFHRARLELFQKRNNSIQTGEQKNSNGTTTEESQPNGASNETTTPEPVDMVRNSNSNVAQSTMIDPQDKASPSFSVDDTENGENVEPGKSFLEMTTRHHITKLI